MAQITGLTRGGKAWTPSFVEALDPTHCIGCGRCYNVCPRSVFELVEREGVMDADLEDDDDDFFADDDDFSDDTSMVMTLKDGSDCIGCEACYRVCPKKCMSHAPAEAA